MKKLLQLLMALTIAPMTFGQLILDNSEMLPFGSSYTLTTASDYSIIDTTIQGQDVTWYLTGLTPDASSTPLVLNMVDPSTTPHGASFPTSNYCYHEEPNDDYRYFTLSSSSMDRVGSYANSTLKTYNDPQTEYVFPMTYSSQNQDTWDNDASSTGGTYNYKVIGTGTLNLPDRSYNAIMVRVHTNESFFSQDTYFWYDADNGSILIQYFIGSGFFTQSSAQYQTSNSLGYEELEAITELNYTNPINDQLNVTFTNAFKGNLTYKITDMIGRVIYQGTPNMINDKGEIRHDFNNHGKGMYFLTFMDADKNNVLHTLRFIKQ